MFNCANTSWKPSIVTDQGGGTTETAEFLIGNVDAHGNFEGSFIAAGGSLETIAGHCSGAEMTFHRPKDNPVYHYVGIFIFIDSKVYSKGTRTRIGGFNAAEASAMSIANLNLASDDWIAEKVT
jgi:hypothetical protein